MWDAVKWTLAIQVVDQMKLEEAAAALLTGDERPDEFFGRLRANGLDDVALEFLALSLPRRLAIAWGRDCLAQTARGARRGSLEVTTISTVNAWMENPSDELRWTAYDAAIEGEYGTPEALLAYAVFASGGSMAAPDCPQQVQPPPDLTGRMVSGALALAAVRAPRGQAGVAKASFLDAGARYASGNVP
jgi:hypothetical protein